MNTCQALRVGCGGTRRRHALPRRSRQGSAVQARPINPMLKAPGIKRVETKLLCTAFKRCFQIQLAPLHKGTRGARGGGGGHGGTAWRILPATAYFINRPLFLSYSASHHAVSIIF